MTDSIEFLRRYRELARSSGWRAVDSPFQLVDRWAEFVGLCTEDYDETIYEYTNDRAVRDALQIVLDDPELARYERFDLLLEAVRSLDAQFLAACRTDVAMAPAGSPWWQRCVPRTASGEFADDLRRLHGIEPARDGP
ncbi:hypothetical protein [Microlunatus soli]|uniref:Uncharacterized protein n=1 Tax=Microlunatus soli TaxID=630515 RepID=A0A1H1TU25_9ACTN|nr:hypothetical protein [Microlunatus soli]SDS63119.1 hypothetical protein SAMN04489812_2504 [Microlunatus soli]